MSNDDFAPIGIFQLPGFDEVYSPHQLKELLGEDDIKVCDGYGHLNSCKWVIQEKKTQRHIKKALHQLEMTKRALEKKSHRVDYAILLIDKIGRAERRKFEVKHYRLFNKNGRSPINIINTPLFVLTVKEFDKLKGSRRNLEWLFR